MNKTKVIFMGTPEFSANILQGLVESDYNVVAVVTQPDKKVGRKQEIVHSPVKQLAQRLQIDVLQPVKIKDEYQMVLDYKPDLIITCAYGQFIPSVILEFPMYKCINVHASLLPKYRGGAPIHKAIINGDQTTGITIMHMIAKMDAGDILAQKEMDIDLCDTTSTLFEKLSHLGKDLLLEMLPKYLNHEIKPIPQEESLVTYAYNISKEEEFVSFKRKAFDVYNHIRGLILWPVGYGSIEEKQIKLHQVELTSLSFQQPCGTLIYQDKKLYVQCLDYAVMLHKVQVVGKQVVSAMDFYNGIGRTLVGKQFK